MPSMLPVMRLEKDTSARTWAGRREKRVVFSLYIYNQVDTTIFKYNK